MLPSIQVLSVGLDKYEIVAQHNINTFNAEEQKRTNKIVKFYKKYYKVKFAINHPNNPTMYYFCNKVSDANYTDISKSDIYIEQKQLELFTEK